MAFPIFDRILFLLSFNRLLFHNDHFSLKLKNTNFPPSKKKKDNEKKHFFANEKVICMEIAIPI